MATKNRKVQVESGVDATGARKGFAEIKDAAKDMAKTVVQEGQAAGKGVEAVGAGTDAAAKKIERDTKSMIAQIQRVTAAAQAGSKDSAAFFTIRAQQRGVDPAALQPYLADLEKVRKAQAAAQGTLDGMGVSAKQTAAALRQLPAQFTDIITSLQGGQKPLTVLFQQGGQIKDSFGGVAPALRAVGGELVALINPTTVAAGAVGLLAYAWYQGQQESDRFTKVLALSGNQIGLTTAQLTDLAHAVREVGAGTQGRASEVLSAIAGDGNVAPDQLQRIAEAAIKLERVGGPAAEATAKMFGEIGRSPVEAALKYNQALNFLTPAIYAQVKALQEQGKTQEAARVASGAAAAALEQQSKQIGEGLGYMERLANATGHAFSRMWDSLVDLQRPNGAIAKKFEEAGTFIEYLQRLIGGGAPVQALQFGGGGAAGLGGESAARKAAAEADAEAKRKQFLATQGLVDLEKQADQFLPRRVAMERELAQARENARKALAGDISDQQRAQIQRTLALTERGIRDKFDAGANLAGPESRAAEIKRGLGLMTAAYADAEAILEAQRKAGLVDEAAYYEAKRRFIELDRQAQVAGIQAEIDLERKRGQDPKLTTQQQAASLQKILDLQADIEKANGKAAASASVLGLQQSSALDAITKAYEQARQSAEDYLTTLVRTQQRDLELFSASNRTRQDQQGRNQIADKYLQDRQRIQNDRALTAIQQGGTLTSDQAKQFDDLLALNSEYEKKALSGYEDYTKRRLELEADWSNGATRAFRNYLDDARDVAKQTEELLTNAFSKAEDALVQFVRTGKLDFRSLADSIISDLLRIQAREALTKAFGYFGFGSAGSAGASGSSGASFDVSGIEPAALGAIFGPHGKITQFANGDVFDQPTRFTYAGGRRGELGEAGPEAIMPLRRGANGKLGVQVTGGGGGVTNIFQIGAGVTRAELVALIPELERRIEAKVQARQRRPGYAGAN